MRQAFQTLLAAAFFVDGIGRLLAVLLDGAPHPFYVAMLAVELALPPLMVMVAKRVQSRSSPPKSGGTPLAGWGPTRLPATVRKVGPCRDVACGHARHAVMPDMRSCQIRHRITESLRRGAQGGDLGSGPQHLA